MTDPLAGLRWTQQAWLLAESVLEARGYVVYHRPDCGGRYGKGKDWSEPTHPHPYCLIMAVRDVPHGVIPVDLLRDPFYFSGC